MAPDKRNKIFQWIGLSTSITALATLLFSGYGFYYRADVLINSTVPTLRMELKEHINNEMLKDDKLVNILNEIKFEQGIQNQKIEDLKETVKTEAQKTIKVIKSE